MKANYSTTHKQNFLERKKDKYCIYKRCKNYKVRTKQMCRAHDKMLNKYKDNNLNFIYFFLFLSFVSIIVYTNYMYQNVFETVFENVYENVYENLYKLYNVYYDIMYKYLSKQVLNETYQYQIIDNLFTNNMVEI